MKRLADAVPHSVSRLSLQYRMHKDICDLCNEIVYKGTLRCANDHISKALLKLENFPSGIPKPKSRFPLQPHRSSTKPSCNDQEWLPRIVDPRYVVVFADTDLISSESNSNGALNVGQAITDTGPAFRDLEISSRMKTGEGGIVNSTEVNLVRHTVNALVRCGLDASEIGVISPFRSQVSSFLRFFY